MRRASFGALGISGLPAGEVRVLAAEELELLTGGAGE
jgi:hypothetical protein